MASFMESCSQAVQGALIAARTAVSQDKVRFKEDGFDLDLTYITNRIIAMALPATSLEAVFRNSINDVAKFLESRHTGHYMVFNLTENAYEAGPFNGAVRHMGWLDHHSPPMIVLIEVVTAIHEFLQADPANVVVVHCKAGRGRTGTVISSYLLYCKHLETPKDAIDFFNIRRSTTGRGVEGPGQVRSVEYLHLWMTERVPTALVFKPPTLYLKRIIMFPVPRLGLRKSCEPHAQIWMNAQVSEELGPTWNSGETKRFHADSSIYMMIEVPKLALTGDVKLRMFNKSLLAKSLLFSLYFNTAMLPADESYLDLTASELDGDITTNTDFSPDFKIRLLLDRIPPM
jgi:protein-tyrosine phosphatase